MNLPGKCVNVEIDCKVVRTMMIVEFTAVLNGFIQIMHICDNSTELCTMKFFHHFKCTQKSSVLIKML